MPKMQPPKGYITATEAKKRLNVSDAMLRYHVQKGRVKYLQPGDRKQGFYLEKDVNKVVNTIDALMGIDEEGEGEEEGQIALTVAGRNDLIEIAKIANTAFSLNTVTVPQWRYMLLEKNQETQYVLKKGDKVIGFATILPFKTSTDKIEKLFRSETVSQAEITSDDIELFEKGNRIHLYIGAIAVDQTLAKSKRRKYAALLVRDLIDVIIELGRRGVIIEKIAALGASHSGVQLLYTFGLHEIPARRIGNRAFIMDIEESGSFVSMQYKQALKEAQGNNKRTVSKRRIKDEVLP